MKYYDIHASGVRIKALRNKSGLTQEELAIKAGVSSDYLGKIERGERGCSVDLFVRLSEIFDVTTDYLIMGDVEKSATVKDLIDKAILLLTKVRDSL